MKANTSTGKQFRVDYFYSGRHDVAYFGTLKEAVAYRSRHMEGIAFLLRLIECVGKYDMIAEI